MHDLMLNPTLQIEGDHDPQLGTRWTIYILFPENGYFIKGISYALVEGIFKVQQGYKIENVFDKDSISYLRKKNILVDRPLINRPVYKCELNKINTNINYSNIALKNIQISKNFTIKMKYHNEYFLIEKAPWNAVIAEYHIKQDFIARVFEWISGNVHHIKHEYDETLLQIGFLITEDRQNARYEFLLSEMQRWKFEFSKSKMLISRNLVGTLEIRALQNYCRNLLKRGYLDGDINYEGRHRVHVFDDEELRHFHKRWETTITCIIGTPVVTSYSFLAFYYSGGILPLHNDKGNCIISASLAIKCSKQKWPMYVHYPNNIITEINWEVGEAAIFDGRTLRHSRPPLPENEESIYLILHFQHDSAQL